MRKATIVTLEVAYLINLALMYVVLLFSSDAGVDVQHKALLFAFMFGTGQIALLPAAFIIASRGPRFRGARGLKIFALQWMAVIPPGCLVFLIGTLIESPPHDGGVSFMFLLLGLPLGLIVATGCFLPALLVSTIILTWLYGARATEETD